jgi:hypothetical protein
VRRQAVALLAGAVIAVRTVEALLSSVHKQVLRQVALSAGAVNRSAHSGSASRQCARVGASSGGSFGWRGNCSAHSGSASPQCARAGVSSGCSFGCRRGNRSAHSGSASPPATSADVHIQCHQRLLDVYRCTPRRSSPDKDLLTSQRLWGRDFDDAVVAAAFECSVVVI